ncbi:MAG: leucine--tRNA ligase [Candidatus Wolfebacteria bacterium]|nr:leucine--tRNA ligase [Candidatus Wolfebacteria bacterium]
MFDHKKVEKKWREKWLKDGIYEPKFKFAGKESKKPFYSLMMFPYPSAEGLHIGGVRTFTGVDIYSRFKRMMGFDVFEPIGLDGFGIHSENYALKVGKHPMKHAKESEKNFYRQLGYIGNSFAWKEALETYDPDYYKWTQWIFTEMFRNGLAYRKKQPVNWCPSCKTVLADEQVINGKCERCGTVVGKRDLEQWFFKITDYAERLLGNIEKLDWSDVVRIAQRNWIGKSEGAEIEFRIKNYELGIKVFTTRPDTLFGATYMVLAPEHEIVKNLESSIKNLGEVNDYIKKTRNKPEEERIAEGKEKTGVELKGIKAINPANKKEIPVFIADYVLAGYGTGAIMAVPAHDERDFEFAKRYKLPIVEVVSPLINADKKRINADAGLYIGGGILINSGQFNGMDSEKAKWEITKFVGGKKKIQYHLRDWLISRQRYWGAPIPMIYCEVCAAKGKGEKENMPGWYAVPEKQLPVKLPFVKNFRPQGDGRSPLASVKSFHETKCPRCKSKARRETDVSDTFLDSAWYFLRYPSANNKKRAWDTDITKKWLPVASYIGGAEHSVLHLLYSRFVTMALKDFGYLDFEEPFSRFRAHGLITKDGAKMSKSKGNVVNPDEYFSKFGADTMRMYLAFLAPFEQGGDFRESGIMGVSRFLARVWSFGNLNKKLQKNASRQMSGIMNKTIKRAGESVDNLHYNTAISALMILLNEIEKKPDGISALLWEDFLKLLSPFAPFITEDLCSGIGHKKSIHLEKCPTYDSELIKEEDFELVIQVNGKVRDRIKVPAVISRAEVEEIALSSEKIKALGIEKSKIKNMIFVPGKLINLVI